MKPADGRSPETGGTEANAGTDPGHPPPGAWRRVDELGTRIGAKHRSFGIALVAFALCLVWNGMTVSFIRHLLAATSERNEAILSTGRNVLTWFAMGLFILMGLYLAGMLLAWLAGRTEVRILDARGEVFIGISKFGQSLRFEPSRVTKVRIDQETRARGPATFIVLELRDGKQIKFGSMLSVARRQFVAAALRKKLLG